MIAHKVDFNLFGYSFVYMSITKKNIYLADSQLKVRMKLTKQSQEITTSKKGKKETFPKHLNLPTLYLVINKVFEGI